MKQIILTLIALVFTFSVFSQTSSLVDGDKCFDSGDYACAITKYNEVIKSTSGRDRQIAEIKLGRARSCSEWLKTANSYFSQQNFTDAKIYYQNVLNENPNDSHAKEQLEKCNNSLVTLRVSKTSLSFSASGGSETVTVTTEAETFSLSELPSWCTSKKNENSFVISCNENTRTIGRTGSVTVTAGNKSQKIRVSQPPKKTEITLKTSTRQILLPQDKVGRATIDVETNASSYEIKGLPQWCEIVSKHFSWFSLTCTANNTLKPRIGSIYVIAEDKEMQIEISQPAGANFTTNTPSQSSSGKITSRNSPVRVKKKKCFNCPQTRDKWGLALGYVQLAYDPFEQMPLTPNTNLNGVQLGLRYEPLFKYGFGLNTGIFFEAHSADLASTIVGESVFEQYSLNIPLHFEYRLNFSKWFNIFAYAGVGLNVVDNSSYNEYSFPVTQEFGAGVRINRLQFNAGQSKYLGNFRDMGNFGKYAAMYQNYALTMSYMF